MVKMLEVLIVISLLKGAYYDSQCGIIPAAIDLLVCLGLMLWEIKRGIKENEQARKRKTVKHLRA